MASLNANLIYLKTYRHQNEPVQNLSLIEHAWDECIELQNTSKNEWVGRSLLSLQGLDRHEIGVFTKEGLAVGAMVIAHDPWDVHVGPCMSVFTQYVLPEYRNRGISLTLMLEALRLTRASNFNILAYTHRVGDGRYETIYKKVTNEIPKD